LNPELYDERVTINAPPMPDSSSDARHNIILGIIVVLGIYLGHAIASALFHIPGI
jgi:hypothetical protein